MKILKISILTIVLAVSAGAQAQQEKPKTKLTGQCVVLAGSGNLQEGPCANLALKIEAVSKKETLYTRTSRDGIFAIDVPADAKLKIGVMSRLYEVISPIEEVSPGRRINLQLKMSGDSIGM